MSYSPHIHMLERPKAILYRFIDVFITEGRLKFDYMNIASVNLPLFLDEFFNQKELLDLLEDLRQQSYDERENDPTSPVIFKSTQTPAAIIGSVCFYINWRMKRKCKKVDLGRPNGPDYKLIKWVVAHAMAAGRAAITVHERFVEALKKRHGEGIKQYVYSRLASPAIDTEHKLFAFTSAGDLSGYIDGYFSPDFLSPSEQMSYIQLLHCMGGLQPAEVMLVSTSLEECRLAAEAAYKVVKVKRPGEPKNRTFLLVKDMSAMAFIPLKQSEKSEKSSSSSSGGCGSGPTSSSKSSPTDGIFSSYVPPSKSSGKSQALELAAVTTVNCSKQQLSEGSCATELPSVKQPPSELKSVPPKAAAGGSKCTKTSSSGLKVVPQKTSGTSVGKDSTSQVKAKASSASVAKKMPSKLLVVVQKKTSAAKTADNDKKI
ncbi:hypothetical protein TYRP_003325 [Tyrophagus putrescentiae]|nr:hypothetical protein TYRP_003325 [Tyrophagus putrescentiae]